MGILNNMKTFRCVLFAIVAHALGSRDSRLTAQAMGSRDSLEKEEWAAALDAVKKVGAGALEGIKSIGSKVHQAITKKDTSEIDAVQAKLAERNAEVKELQTRLELQKAKQKVHDAEDALEKDAQAIGGSLLEDPLP